MARSESDERHVAERDLGAVAERDGNGEGYAHIALVIALLGGADERRTLPGQPEVGVSPKRQVADGRCRVGALGGELRDAVAVRKVKTTAQRGKDTGLNLGVDHGSDALDPVPLRPAVAQSRSLPPLAPIPVEPKGESVVAAYFDTTAHCERGGGGRRCGGFWGGREAEAPVCRAHG